VVIDQAGHHQTAGHVDYLDLRSGSGRLAHGTEGVDAIAPDMEIAVPDDSVAASGQRQEGCVGDQQIAHDTVIGERLSVIGDQ
jgi:hypothetical protein